MKRNFDGSNIAAKRRRRSIISAEHKNPSDSEGRAQCFKVVPIKLHVAVAPEFSFAIADGVKKQHLDPLIMNYYQPTRGVVISYSDLRLLGQDSVGSSTPAMKIIGDSPFGWMWVRANLLVWSPVQGDLVEGWISLQSPGHIALLIHDTFNATIRREDIPQTWEFVPSQDDEVDSKSLGYWKDARGRRIEGKLAFTVKYANFSGRTVLVHGSLLTEEDVKLPTIGADTKTPASKSTSSVSKKIKFDDLEAGIDSETVTSQVPTPPDAEDDDDLVPVEQNSSDDSE